MAQMDWQNGVMAFDIQPDVGPEWSVVLAGDWAPLGDQVCAAIDHPQAFCGDLAPILQEADLALVNVEGVLGSAGQPVTKDGPHLALLEAAAEALVAAPFHVACLANNHSMDYGPLGLVRTRERLARIGVATVGAGQNAEEACRPLVCRVQGIRVAIVNAAEGEEGRSVNGGRGVADLDQDRLTRQVSALRHDAEVVIAVLHAGREFTPVPPPYLQRLCRTLVEAGADLVVGHHPHVPQGLEI